MGHRSLLQARSSRPSNSARSSDTVPTPSAGRFTALCWSTYSCAFRRTSATGDTALRVCCRPALRGSQRSCALQHKHLNHFRDFDSTRPSCPLLPPCPPQENPSTPSASLPPHPSQMIKIHEENFRRKSRRKSTTPPRSSHRPFSATFRSPATLMA